MSRISTLLALVLLPTFLFANEQFTYECKDGTFLVAELTCEINSEENKSVTITKFKYNDGENYPDFKMPDTVEYEGETYTITVIGESAFQKEIGKNSNLRNLTLPANIVEISDNAFRGMDLIETIVLPFGLTTIGVSAFDSCKALKEINLPESLSYIGKEAFVWCMSLTELTIPETVEYIPENICEFCHNLQRIYLGSNVQTIANGAFTECQVLSEIYIKTITPPEALGSFISYHITIYIPEGTKDEYKSKWEVIEYYDPEYIEYYPNDDGGQTAGMNSIGRTKLTVTQIGDNSLQICNIDGHLSVYSLLGTKVGEYFSKDVILNLPSGIYILKTDSTVKKVIIH